MIDGDKAKERVLVLGDDMRIFLALVRSLGRAGKEVHAAPFDRNAPALRSKYVSKVHHFPSYSDSPEAWVSSVREALRSYSIDLLIPSSDRAIHPLHAHREAFADHRIAIPNADAMDLLFDKERTRQLAADLGIPVASGAPLDPAATAHELADRFGLPLVLKPKSSYSLDRLESWGKVWIVDTEAELAPLLRTLEEPSRYLVEGYFEGVGVGVSVLAHNGAILQAFQHRRLRQGRGGSSSYRVSEPVNPELRAACEKVARHTQLTGVCMFEFRFNPADGSWILIETNARFWGSCPLPISLGVDFPRFLHDLLVHGIQHPPVAYKAGVRSRNLLLDGFNLFGGVRELGRNELGRWTLDVADFLTQPIRWASGQERSDTFVRDDPWPGIWEIAGLGRTFRGRLKRNQEADLDKRALEGAAGPVALPLRR